MTNNYGLNKKYEPKCQITGESGKQYLIVEINRVPQSFGKMDIVEYAIYEFDGKKAGARLGKGNSPIKLEEKYVK